MSDLREAEGIDRIMLRARAERARAVARNVRALAAAAAAGARAVRAWFRRRAAYRALQALDDRTLKDVGLYRNDLWRVAGGEQREAAPAAPPPAATDDPERLAPAANDNPLWPRSMRRAGRRG
ncbi:uncharacterized protein YjiS (DUF1127 family) [Constrictibacter sp. MBR-5]|jgi:uncharacterized protein YjiS (DUF1127 family)|uniref:DUF1127 domain-containing protein n=1 Tax=Constrictibacter sp. MBR-5 TaxID=3156467 RepID=UPI003399B3D3